PAWLCVMSMMRMPSSAAPIVTSSFIHPGTKPICIVVATGRIQASCKPAEFIGIKPDICELRPHRFYAPLSRFAQQTPHRGIVPHVIEPGKGRPVAGNEMADHFWHDRETRR